MAISSATLVSLTDQLAPNAVKSIATYASLLQEWAKARAAGTADPSGQGKTLSDLDALYVQIAPALNALLTVRGQL